MKCIVCDSDKVISGMISRELSLPYAGSLSIEIHNDHCQNCDQSGDFEGKNDNLIIPALHNLQFRAILNITQYLGEQGYKIPYVERVLGIPQRTITRWVRGEFSSSDVALLSMIRTYPWLLQAAEGRYNTEEVVMPETP